MSSADLTAYADTCTVCGAPVYWASTPGGKRLTVNTTPDERRGNILLAVTPRGLVAGYLGHNQAAGARNHGQPLRTAHHTDCPHSDRQARR